MKPLKLQCVPDLHLQHYGTEQTEKHTKTNSYTMTINLSPIPRPSPRVTFV